jgi:hypothetical protein
MVFIRGRQPEAVIWQHFRSRGDGFVFGVRDGICESHLHTNATRAVELFLALAEYLPPALTVRLDDWRSGHAWQGERLANADARNAIARIKSNLTTLGGVECTLLAEDEQLTLTANLEIYVYARTDRWLYLLQGLGLRRQQRLRGRSWMLRRGEFAQSPEMEAAVAGTVERLGLVKKEVAESRGAES